MNINAILSGSPAWSVRGVSAGGAPDAGSNRPVADGVAAGSARDTFERGQWWKNRATAGVEQSGVNSCSCGSCASCGVRAYAAFARRAEQGAEVVSAASVRPPPAAATRQEMVGGVEGAGRAAGADQLGTVGTPTGSGLGAVGVGDDAGGVEGRAGEGASSVAAPSPAGANGTNTESAKETERNREEGADPAGLRAPDGRSLSREEQLEVARLQQVDTQVKAHEMAHLAVAGPYARGGANFSYSTGPDGRKYATGGEVSIDTSKEPSPDATIRKMRTIQAAAMAPANPSPQDRKVAAQADAAIVEANRELEMIRLEQQREESRRELDARFGNSAQNEGGISPVAARRALDAFSGLGRNNHSQLHFTV